jgi:hypothetical protein
LAVLKPNRIIRKCTDVNCSSFHLRVFLGLSNPQGQRQTSTLSILHGNFGVRKAKFNLEMSRETQCNCYNCYNCYHSKESTQGVIVKLGREGRTIPV